MRGANRVWVGLAAGLLLLGGWAAPFGAQEAAKPALSESEKAAVTRLSVETIKAVTVDLAAPEMEGRGSGQAGGAKAARYIAERMERIGLKPLGDRGSYLQRLDIRGFRVLPESSVTVNGRTFRHGEGCLFSPFFLTRTRLREKVDRTGGVVFAGYGVVSPALKRDDLKGLDLRGKLVALLPGFLPAGAKAREWTGVSFDTITRGLARRGAKGVLFLTEAKQFGAGEETKRWAGLREWPRSLPGGAPPVAYLGGEASEALFAGGEAELREAREKARAGGFVSRPLPARAGLSLRAAFEAERTPAYNVCGVLEGSDAALKAEALVYTAHYDAYGKGPDGRIYPGAADNALGTANLLAVAEAFARGPRPRRSLVFLAVTGEEMGLLGAFHWVNARPTWPLAKIAANLNFDGIGTEVRGAVKVFYAMAVEQSDLQPLLTDAAQALGGALMLDANAQEGIFQRSDQFEFAQRGIPAVYAFGIGGNPLRELARARAFLNEHYHEPTDTVRPDWDWAGPRDLAAFYLVTGLRIAQSDRAPAWRPGSDFDRPRGAEPPVTR